jgi:SAM-dependent methyltransferase
MKTTGEQLKDIVKEKYTQIAETPGASGCCDSSLCCGADTSIMAASYAHIEGYVPEADKALGCGLPTEFAQIKPGDTVVDLGSGAGNDAFVARAVTGEKGRVIGIDLTEKMVQKAKENAAKMNFTNVEFILGDIEHMPMPNSVADVVVSNCVLNLVPDKKKAFDETFRILKTDGHFSISDIVWEGEVPEKILSVAELYAGCVSGAIQKSSYLRIVEESGFVNLSVQKENEITLPEELLLRYLSQDEVNAFRKSKTRLLSVTLYGEKPAEKKSCCGPECCS